MNKEELEKKYPVGSAVELLGSRYNGIVRGNFRILYPKEGIDISAHTWAHNDPELKEMIAEVRNGNEGTGEWFVDVEVLGIVKPLNIIMIV